MTEPWGKSYLEQIESSTAYPYLFKTKKTKPLPILAVPERKKCKRASLALYKTSVRSSINQARSSFYMNINQRN